MIWHHTLLTHPTKKTFQNNIKDPTEIIATLEILNDGVSWVVVYLLKGLILYSTTKTCHNK
jgi:hypothetical protein